MNTARVELEHLKVITACLVTGGLRIVDESNDAATCGCGATEGVERRRLNTAFADDESNWATCCDVCFGQLVDHYADLWDLYYHG